MFTRRATTGGWEGDVNSGAFVATRSSMHRRAVLS